MAKLTKQPDKPCMTDECDKLAKWKGLCPSCYGQAKHLIDTKQVEGWEELEDMGLVEVAGKPFVKAFKLKKQAAARPQENNSPPPLPPA